MNLDDYAYEDDGRWYVKPQVSLDEQNAFIQNLRGLQEQGDTMVQNQTHALGTQVPSNLGGLTGGSGYFASRLQTPKINNMVAGLRATNQAQALKTAMQNDIAKAQKTYNELYRKNELGLNGNGGGGKTDPDNEVTGDVEYEDASEKEIDPEGTDTIEEVNTDPRYNTQDESLGETTIRNIGEATENVSNVYGGTAPFGYQNVDGFYYVTNEGTKVPFRIVNTGRGSQAVLIDTGLMSSTNPYAILDRVVSEGGKIYSPKGVDVSATYRLFF